MFAGRRVEVPTIILGILIYSSWLGLTYFFHALPLLVALPAAAFIVAWHSSLQHEACHGHPTESERFNALFAGISLWLYLPFPLYRESHLAHHRSEHLSSPIADSESFYFTQAQWQGFSPATRLFWTAHNTLLGRFFLGPLVVIARVYPPEIRKILSGDTRRLGIWCRHGLVVAGILLWVTQVCGIAIYEYLLFFVYPGMALSLLRSFAEHTPGDTQDERIAIVEADPVFSLLFLHNNLHLLHHHEPGLPWYRYQARYAETRDALLRANGGRLYRGYGEVARRFLVRPIAVPVHPTVRA